MWPVRPIPAGRLGAVAGNQREQNPYARIRSSNPSSTVSSMATSRWMPSSRSLVGSHPGLRCLKGLHWPTFRVNLV